jgi:hypothetical protein
MAGVCESLPLRRNWLAHHQQNAHTSPHCRPGHCSIKHATGCFTAWASQQAQQSCASNTYHRRVSKCRMSISHSALQFLALPNLLCDRTLPNMAGQSHVVKQGQVDHLWPAQLHTLHAGCSRQGLKNVGSAGRQGAQTSSVHRELHSLFLVNWQAIVGGKYTRKKAQDTEHGPHHLGCAVLSQPRQPVAAQMLRKLLAHLVPGPLYLTTTNCLHCTVD